MEDLAQAVREAARRERERLESWLSAEAGAVEDAARAEVELQELARVAGKAMEELGSGEDYGLWVLDMAVLRWYCQQILKDVCGRARTMGDVVATVKLVREFIRAGRGQDYGRRLAELSQSRYSALVAGGMTPRDAQRAVGNGMYDRKQSQRDLTRLSDEENKMLWQAAKEMAFPPNYRREAQAWLGRRGGPMPKRLQGRVEVPWLIVPSSQPVIAEPAEKHGQG